MKDTVRLGLIGLGRRGTYILREVLRYMPDVEIAAVCDVHPERMEHAAKLLAEFGKKRPVFYSDYHELVKDPALDAVSITAGWNIHVDAALSSLRAGKYTAMEVGVAYDLSECYALVEAHEATGAPLMMMENSCFDRRELMALRLVRDGIFGELVHAEGGYHHYLPDCDLFKKREDGTIDTDHYRLTEYQYRNAEQYPTHDLGPIAKALNIGRGNRMLTLCSVASKSRALSHYMSQNVPVDHPFQGVDFKQGDVVNTIITCAGGETILLTLDTTLPMPDYSRAFQLRGTKGGCLELGKLHGSFWAEGITEGRVFDNEQEFFANFNHPIYEEYDRHGGREGLDHFDWVVYRAFLEAVKNGTDTPVNAYDTAAWMAIGPLSEISIRNGGAPVGIPDFTRGKWLRPGEPLHGKYSLDEIKDYPDVPLFPGDTY